MLTSTLENNRFFWFSIIFYLDHKTCKKSYVQKFIFIIKKKLSPYSNEDVNSTLLCSRFVQKLQKLLGVDRGLSRLLKGVFKSVFPVFFKTFPRFFPDFSPIFIQYFPDFYYQNIKRGGTSTLSSPIHTPLWIHFTLDKLS